MSIESGISSNGSYRHGGEEFIAVVHGRFELSIDDNRVHVLGAGDSIYFSSELPHAWRNPGPDTCELLWICTGNSF